MKRNLLSILLLSAFVVSTMFGCGQHSPAAQINRTPASSSIETPETTPETAPTTSSQTAVDATSSASAASSQPAQETASETSSEATPATDQTAAPQAPQTMQIRVTGLNQSIVFELNNSSAAKSLYDQLSLFTEVEDYASNEKIFYPPEKLDTSDTPLMGDGGAGALGYYAPWGDVILYYDSFSPGDGLYFLGTVVSGADQIESLSGTIQVDAYSAT